MQRQAQQPPHFTPWPDPPTEEFLATLRPDHNLLVCWERWLYTKHLKAHEDGVIYEGREGKPAKGWIPE
jgi:hypothetical protein